MSIIVNPFFTPFRGMVALEDKILKVPRDIKLLQFPVRGDIIPLDRDVSPYVDEEIGKIEYYWGETYMFSPGSGGIWHYVFCEFPSNRIGVPQIEFWGEEGGQRISNKIFFKMLSFHRTETWSIWGGQGKGASTSKGFLITPLEPQIILHIDITIIKRRWEVKIQGKNIEVREV
jgi:hypothetical protein